MAYSLLLLATLSCLLAATSAADNLIRPCKPGDLYCLGKFFTAHGRCTLPVLSSPALDPHKLAHFYFETPYFNVTEDRYNLTLTGASKAVVQDFFYNTASKRAVLVINFPTFRSEATVHLHYRLTGTEGMEIVTDTVVNFVNLTITTVFTNYNMLSLKDSYSFPDIPTWPTFENGKGLAEAAKNDARAARLSAAYGQLPMVATMEAFKYRAPYLAQLYSSHRICNNL